MVRYNLRRLVNLNGIEIFKENLYEMKRIKENYDDKKTISQYCVSIISRSLKENKFSDIWNLSNTRWEIFEQTHVYFGAGYRRYYSNGDWGQIFEFYEHFLEYEIHEMLSLRTSFDLTEKKIPQPVLKREKIQKLFKYLKEVQDDLTKYEYDGTKELEKRIKKCKESFIDFKKLLQELYAHLLFEEKDYIEALQLYTRLAKEHDKADSFWHSSTFWRKGDIYCAREMYDLALKEYDLAVIDGLEKEQIQEIKIRKSQIAAILGQYIVS